MEKIVSFKSDKDHYKADACVVWCFDDRFSQLLEKAKIKLSLKKIDQVEIAGGAKELTNPGIRADFILDQIDKSIKLHYTPLIVLMVHKDCGAYVKFDVSDENEFFSDQLMRAKNVVEKFLKEKSYSADVKIYLADFDGLWKLE